ncbi:MAG: flagellar hook-associated protein FlgK [Bacteroidales bacterium]|nr:flagellar hook-associated protein FlgK [Candidatus Latescibacterota bacterium]
MTTLFGMLEMNKRSLFTSQFSLQTTNNNISNINNPGYSRQEALLQSNIPTVSPVGILGNGVTVSTIRRATAEFYTRQLRDETSSMNGWNARSSTLSHMETIFNEPSDSGMANKIDEFFNSWNTLASEPESGSARIDIVESARSMCAMFHNMDESLQELRDNLNDQIVSDVGAVNELTEKIASLNNMIVEVESIGHTAGDYRDERDRLLQQLSGIIQVEIREDDFGSIDLFIRGVNVVHRSETVSLDIQQNDDGETVTMQVVLKGQHVSLNLGEGSLAGLLHSRDGYVNDTQESLDYLAASFIERVNELHNSGWSPEGSGFDFFRGTDAMTIDIAYAIESNPGIVASSYDGTVGDNSLANDIVALSINGISEDDPFTFNERYGSLVTTIGIHGSNAQDMLRNSNMIVSNLQLRKESITGVSLDEELVNLTRFQQSYEAAARVMTVVGEMIDSILDMR